MVLRLFVVLVLCLAAGPSWAAEAWRVTKSEWSAADEQGYSAFIQRIGEDGCETPDDCINSDANPYRGTDGRGDDAQTAGTTTGGFINPMVDEIASRQLTLQSLKSRIPMNRFGVGIGEHAELGATGCRLGARPVHH